MTHHNPDLGSASDWLNQPCGTTNQKHYPDLGSDVSSVWNFCACFSATFGEKTSGSVTKCMLFSQAKTQTEFEEVQKRHM